jgi:hypothetical protein
MKMGRRTFLPTLFSIIASITVEKKVLAAKVGPLFASGFDDVRKQSPCIDDGKWHYIDVDYKQDCCRVDGESWNYIPVELTGDRRFLHYLSELEFSHRRELGIVSYCRKRSGMLKSITDFAIWS